MDPARLEQVFDGARTRAGAERAAYLDRACAGDPALRAEVEELLAHLEADPGFLETPAAEALGGDLDPARDLGGLERLGPYRLLRLLGEGGMGAVFLAEQEHPRREVAVKIVHPAFLSPTARRRLEREGQALARLQHPSIARVIEVGEAPGPGGVSLAYVAMERLHGLPITEAADAAGLDLRARLALVARVADALQHAHERGVVHRDLKPSNVLVTEDGHPQVLDFGIARVLDETLETLTASGQVVGTPAYMAPEQLAGGPAGASPLVDVHALGALAYELLAGRPPLDLEGAGPVDLVRLARGAEPVPLRKVASGVPADVATIVHRALAREPKRRYASAADLAADLRRYLVDEPIHARPPSAIYLVGKLARRRRAALTALGVVLAVGSLALFLVVRSRGETRQRTEQVRSLLGMVADRLDAGDPFESGSLTPEQERELAGAEAWVEAHLDGSPLLAAELLTTLARIQRHRGELEQAEDLARRALARCEPAHAGTVEAALAHNQVGLARLARGAPEEAEPHFLAAFPVLDGAGAARREMALSVQNNLALALKQQRRYDEAEALYRQCLAARTALLGPDDEATASTRSNLARLLEDSGRDPAGAVELQRQAVASDSRTRGADTPYTLVTRSHLGGALVAAGELEEAEALLREVAARLAELLGDDHPDALAAHRNLVRALTALEDHAAAREVLEGMLPAMHARFGEHDHRTLEITTRWARASASLGDAAAAAEAWAAVEAGRVASAGASSAAAVDATLRHAHALEAAGDADGARAAFARALERAQAGLAEDDALRSEVETDARTRGL